MMVCNACRYCEAYCPVFRAMENRRSFSKGDLTYLANLCHNCGECLYACQYAPPHEFGINVPKTMSELRVAAYEEYCERMRRLTEGRSVFSNRGLLASNARLAGQLAVGLAATARP